jgi:single-stranded-DNA-specific exonuclease
MQIREREVTNQNIEAENLPPLLARIYASRGVTSGDELAYGLKHLHDPDLLGDMDRALALLFAALQQQARVLIVADFDTDGATSCAVAMRALRMFGFRHVDFLVPNRFEYGYGLTPEIVELAKTKEPDLLITVDNGISSHAGVAAASAAGIKVLVTDHHLPADSLPQADAIVNPNKRGDDFPSKAIAGVGVIFYVMLALRKFLRDKNWYATHTMQEPNLAQLLDLVALGTVADVVPLDYNNRILVSQGLARIRAGECVPGIKALLDFGRTARQQVVAADLGFIIAPRLNAAGRMHDMSVGIECLLSDDPMTARSIAQQLDALNLERREVERTMQDQAMQVLDEIHYDPDSETRFGITLYDPHWHQGVIGILASRIKDKFHRPVIIFANADKQELKGSARSVKNVHIRDALDTIAAQHPGLINKFGGHAMAAGLSLPAENLPLFQRAFNEEVARHLSEDDLKGLILTDGQLQPEEMSLVMAEQLRNAGPWGQAFPEPVFHGDFRLVSRRIVAENHLKMTLTSGDGAQILDAIAFNHTDASWPAKVEKVRLAYRLDVNEYQGRRSVQMLVMHVEPA